MARVPPTRFGRERSALKDACSNPNLVIVPPDKSIASAGLGSTVYAGKMKEILNP